MDFAPYISAGTTVATVLWCVLIGCDADSDGSMEHSAVHPSAIEQSETNPDVVAQVNNHQITREEVDRRLERIDEIYRHSQRTFDEEQRAIKKREVIDRLIERELLRQYIAQSEVEIADGEVDAVLERRIARDFGSRDAFHRYLETEAMTVDDFRRHLRQELVIEEVLTRRLEEEPIDEEQLRGYYNRIANRRPADDRIHATRISIRIDSDTAVDKQGQIREGLSRLLPRVGDLEELTVQLREYEAPLRARVIPPRWLEPRHLPADSVELLFGEDAPESGASPIIDRARGFDIFWIHDRREAGVRDFEEVRDLVYDRAQRSRLQRERRHLLDELKTEATISIHLPEIDDDRIPEIEDLRIE